jgi:hypothetical protein
LFEYWVLDLDLDLTRGDGRRKRRKAREENGRGRAWAGMADLNTGLLAYRDLEDGEGDVEAGTEASRRDYGYRSQSPASSFEAEHRRAPLLWSNRWRRCLRYLREKICVMAACVILMFLSAALLFAL